MRHCKLSTHNTCLILEGCMEAQFFQDTMGPSILAALFLRRWGNAFYQKLAGRSVRRTTTLTSQKNCGYKTIFVFNGVVGRAGHIKVSYDCCTLHTCLHTIARKNEVNMFYRSQYRLVNVFPRAMIRKLSLSRAIESLWIHHKILGLTKWNDSCRLITKMFTYRKSELQT